MNSRARSFCFILIAAGILPATNHTGAPAALAAYPHRNQTAEPAKDTAAQARPKGESLSETAARSAPPSKKITERRRLSEYGEDAGESQSEPRLSESRSDEFLSALGGSNDARSTPDLAVDGPNSFDTLGKVTDGLTRTAQSGEPACGPGAGDCCSSNGTPGCEDVDCCNDICVADPFCCDGFWDGICAAAAEGNPLCDEGSCSGGDPACGPGAGDCCSSNGSAGCDDVDCCNDICVADPFCCVVTWDGFCAAAAEGNPLCNEGSCGDPACGPGAGDCCSSNGTPGCDDEDCCNCICACDPFCCGNEPLGFWDSLCAGEGFVPGCGASNTAGLCTAECSECLPVGDGDECEDCIPVGEGVHANTTADNTGAADDSSCGLDDVVDEWYCYTAGCTGTATAKTCQDVSVPFNDSVLAVFEAPCGGAEIACDDDGCGAPNGFLSEVSWSVVAGNTYNIRVSAWNNGQGGDYLLEIICQLPPENDDCAGAIPVAVPSTTSGSTTGALPDSAPFCGTSDGTGGAVWYSVLGTGNRITATTCDSTSGDFCTGGGSANYDTKIRVYTDGCEALTCKTGNDNNCTGGSSALRSTVSWCSTEGTEYLILVHGFGSSKGDFVLEVCDDGVGCAAGPVCPLSSCEGSTATVTQSNTTSNGNNQVACGAGGNTTENAWARCYDLTAEGVSNDLTINSVTFGVQRATIDGIQVNVNLYLDSDGCPPGEPGVDAILLDSVSTVVNTADEGSLITLNFPGGPVAPAGSTLIVEIEAPADGTEEPLHAFRAMSNSNGQCGSSYIRAADCGLGNWTALEDIGFPDAHLVQIVNGTSDCGCQSDDECDDGDACTDDACVDGGCVHTPVDCSGAGDQCNTASCDPNGVEGNCDILTPLANGTPCNDGEACTENDQCTAGVCGGTAVDCTGAGDQCNTASCDSNGAEGNCDTLTPVANGTLCNDGNACTDNDQCTAGNCGGTAVDCSGAGDQCNTASCDPNGADSNCDILTPVANGTPCNDDDACTENDQCTTGSCGGTAVDCSRAGDQCNIASCNPAGADGNCDTLTPLANGTPCSDGDVCNGNELCFGGICEAGTPPDCDDVNPCTDDGCDPLSGCVNTANDANSCSDGDACNGGELCVGGICQAGTPLDCNDNGVPDCQDIDNMTSGDCDGDGVPDECELPKSSGGLCTGGCASDCDGNGVIDSCDLANCPPDTPSCDDCNVNGTLDGCDVDPLDPDGDGQVSADGNEDGVPDECVEATGAGDWSGDIWGLGGNYPDNDPKNPEGVPDISVTLDGANLTVFADVTVEIPSLRLINAASLDVTQAGDQGDLTIFDPNGVFDGNLLIEGTLNIGGGRVIDAAGTVTIGDGGVYKSIFGFEGPGSGDLTAADVVVKCGGSLRLEGSMQLGTGGSIILSEDDGKGDCTPPDFEAGDDSSTQVGGDFKILGSANIVYDSTQPLLLSGDFDNQSTDAETFDWSAGGILLNGPPHTIEAAGRERGPCLSGLADNFAFGSLELAENTLVRVVDDFDNQGDGLAACDETVYVDLLKVPAGAVLLTEGCRVYFKQLELAKEGSIPGLGTDVLQILEGCPPDFDNNGAVGAFDLAILLGAWGLCPEPCTPGEPAATCATDLSGDCVTGAFDLALLLGSWGPV